MNVNGPGQGQFFYTREGIQREKRRPLFTFRNPIEAMAAGPSCAGTRRVDRKSKLWVRCILSYRFGQLGWNGYHA
jgi:hypothetical protein